MKPHQTISDRSSRVSSLIQTPSRHPKQTTSHARLFRDEKLKKAQTACDQIDDKNIGFVKKAVFLKLLECLDIKLSLAEHAFAG